MPGVKGDRDVAAIVARSGFGGAVFGRWAGRDQPPPGRADNDCGRLWRAGHSTNNGCEVRVHRYYGADVL